MSQFLVTVLNRTDNGIVCHARTADDCNSTNVMTFVSWWQLRAMPSAIAQLMHSTAQTWAEAKQAGATSYGRFQFESGFLLDGFVLVPQLDKSTGSAWMVKQDPAKVAEALAKGYTVTEEQWHGFAKEVVPAPAPVQVPTDAAPPVYADQFTAPQSALNA